MNQQQIETFLQSVEIFHGLQPEQLRRLAKAARDVRFGAGERLSESAGDTPQLCVLLEGEAIELLEQLECGMEVQSGRLYAGDSFGIDSIVAPRPSTCRVTAFTPGRAILIDGSVIEELFRDSPEFARAVCRLLAARLHRAHELVHGVRFVDLSSFPDIKSAMSLLPKRICSISRSLAVERDGDRVTVAMVNPSDIGARTFIEDILREYHVQFAAISEENFEDEGRKLLGECIESGTDEDQFERMLYLDGEGEMRPLAGSREDDLLSHLLTVALRRGASDIHFEPYHGRARVRLRVDGRMLLIEEELTADTYRHLLARVKVLAELSTTRRIHLPQEGRFMLEVDDQPIEFRVTVSDCHGGETVVVRIIAPGRQFGGLSRLILEPSYERMARELFSHPSGLILVTGPAGAGKTTTLYTALRSIVGNDLSRSVMTVEDPVEYDLPFATQFPVRHESQLDYAAGLRSVLRQDPDVILIGEIRDAETAALAAEAAATGRLVLSSVHTYSALDAVIRLRDLQVPPYLIGAGLRGVIAQQLVPRLEPGFTQEVAPDDPVVGHLVELGVLDHEWNFPLVRGTDAPDGPPGGESGRVALWEMVSVTPTLTAKIDSNITPAQLSEMLGPGCCLTYPDYARFLLREGIVAPERIAQACHAVLHPGAVQVL